MSVVKFLVMNVLNLVVRPSLIFLFILPSVQLSAQSETHRMESVITNAYISRIAHSNGYTMLMGDFNQIGPFTGSSVLVDASTAAVEYGLPSINGYIDVVIPDGNGGWYVGGIFSSVGSLPYKNLVHINSDKSLDTSFKPDPGSRVLTLALSGNTLYVGGFFNIIAGTTRNFLAAINTTTGALTSWDPNAGSYVNTISISGNTLYAGGAFTTMGGLTRNRIAAIDATTGAVNPTWAPSITGAGVYVNTIVATPSTIYFGGNFTTVGITARAGLAAVNSSGALLAWNPNPGVSGIPSVLALALSGSILYVGGYFTTMGGITHKHLAAVDATTAAVQAWNPVLDNFDQVTRLEINGSTVYAIGYFDSVNGVTRSGLAAINGTNGSLLAWDPQFHGTVSTISANGNTLFAGGNFNGVNWTFHPNLAIINNATDEVLPFDIDLGTGYALTMAVKDNIAYIGGQFTLVNKLPRNNLVAIDLTDGQVLPWAPSVSGTATGVPALVTSVEIKDNLLYVGGYFLNVNAQNRSGLAAIDLTTGAPNNWNPNVGSDGFVNSLDVVDNTVYAAGSFTTVGGLLRTDLAAVDASSGAVLSWAPTCDGSIYKIRVAQNAAYVVGDFGKDIGGQFRNNRIAALNLTTGAATSFNPDLKNGSAADIALSETDLYVAGYFDAVGLEPRNGLASFSLSTDNFNSWKPDIGLPQEGGPQVYALATSSTRLFVGGGFEYLGEENRTYYAEYDICPPPAALSFNGTTLTSTPADTYQWHLNNAPLTGETSQTLEINAFEYGTYFVEVNNNGCISRSEDFVYLITSPESAIDKLLVAYPNPVYDNLYIKASSPGDYEITLHDVMGKMVKRVRYTGPELNVDVRDLHSGTYLLIVQTDGQRQVKKIVKTR